MRKAGALLAISSLPSTYGVGDLGNTAYEFIDILVQMKMRIWQVLPLNPLGFGNSPYQGYSSFAGDPIYISIEKLHGMRLLDNTNHKTFKADASFVEYENVKKFKEPILRNAYANFKNSFKDKDSYEKFVKQNLWLKNFAVFMLFKGLNNLQSWANWLPEHKSWIKDKKFDLTPYADEINYQTFLQFIFYQQWLDLKAYANNHDIEIMGDIPIYLGYDSVDVWENQKVFLLDDRQNPTHVAGVPPDFFSKTGQRWGNPLYDWDALEKQKFKFWIERLRGNAKLFDIIRIDHFRAFDTYWKIPASCTTALEGEWVEAPGYALFDMIFKELPEINIVAEDLGLLRPEVLELRDHYNLKGMKVFQFHFDLNGKNDNFTTGINSIIYTGTHDNNTLMGWYNELSPKEQQKLNKIFDITDATSIKYEIIKFSLWSEAEYVIFPVQDLLGLDSSSRFNVPGEVGSPNWEWKLKDFKALKKEISEISQLIINSNR